MAIYRLRNNIVLDDVRFAAPVVGSFQPIKLDFRPNFLPKSRVTWHSKEVSDNGIAIQPAIRFNAAINASNLSQQLLKRCNVRFIQIIRLRMMQVDYYGSKEEDGFTTYFFKDKLLEEMLDCVVTPTGDRAVDFPYYNLDPDNIMSNGYFSSINDNPGGQYDLVVFNPETKKNNFFFRFSDSIEFEAVVVFVHADGTREPLESWRWTLERDLQIVWRNGEPQPSVTPKAVITPDPTKKVVFEKLNLEALVIKNKVMNIEGNDAYLNFRSHPDVAYLKGKGVKPPDGFWLFT